MVLGHLAEGRSNKEIATRMGIVVKTVEKHNERIFRKLDARSRTESLAIARRTGIAPDAPAK